MTGDAPVPVPPPMPAVMNTMSGAVEELFHALAVLQCRLAANLGIGAGAEPPW